jgi:hypothetical protein
MPVAEAVVDRLIARGRDRGRLDPADIGAEVPLDRLTVVDMADLVDRLDDAGIVLDIDPRLLVARAGVAPGRRDAPSSSAGVGVFTRPAPTGVADRPHDSARTVVDDHGAGHGAGHGDGTHGAAPMLSPTVLAIGSMVVSVALILLIVAAAQPGG